MTSRIVLMLCCVIALSGCDSLRRLKNKIFAKKEAVTAASPRAQSCATAPQIIKGTCGGSWSVQKGKDGDSCNFTWGPAVRCPAGKRSLIHEAECYGVTSKPLGPRETVSSAKECADKFGKSPQVIDYELQCCDS